MECLQHWGALIGSALRPSLALPGKDFFEKEAKQLSLQNSFTPAPARVWLNRPWIISSTVPLEVDSAAIALAKFGVGSSSPNAEGHVGRLWMSFSVDPQGLERDHARGVVSSAPSSALVVLDAPRHLCLRTWVEEHFLTGDWQHLDYITSHLGSFSARRRNLSVRGFGAPLELSGARSVPPSMLPLDTNVPSSPEKRHTYPGAHASHHR